MQIFFSEYFPKCDSIVVDFGSTNELNHLLELQTKLLHFTVSCFFFYGNSRNRHQFCAAEPASFLPFSLTSHGLLRPSFPVYLNCKINLLVWAYVKCFSIVTKCLKYNTKSLATTPSNKSWPKQGGSPEQKIFQGIESRVKLYSPSNLLAIDSCRTVSLWSLIVLLGPSLRGVFIKSIKLYLQKCALEMKFSVKLPTECEPTPIAWDQQKNDCVAGTKTLEPRL